MRRTAPTLIVLLLLGACGSDEPDEPGAAPPPSSTTSGTAPMSGTAPTTVAVAPATVAVVAVHEDVNYYGACGNETVVVDGVTYYPMYFEDVRALDTTRYPVVTANELRGFRSGAVRVAPPGPGDDVGTFVVYADGSARFESVSGWVIWLTTTRLTYEWEC